jgi:nitrogen fixation protein FixH
MTSGAKQPPQHEQQKTARIVLVSLVGFFAVVLAVNAIMVHAAVSTFGGVETESSYKAGLAFAKEMAAAAAQDSRRWHINATVTPQQNAQRLELIAHDAEGRPLLGLTAVMHFSHPADRRADVTVTLPETAPGRFTATASPAAGQWDLIVELLRGGERIYRSKSRVLVKSG